MTNERRTCWIGNCYQCFALRVIPRHHRTTGPQMIAGVSATVPRKSRLREHHQCFGGSQAWASVLRVASQKHEQLLSGPHPERCKVLLAAADFATEPEQDGVDWVRSSGHWKYGNLCADSERSTMSKRKVSEYRRKCMG